MNKRKIVLASMAAVVIALLGGAAWYYGIIGNSDRRLFNRIKDNPTLVELYTKAKNKEAEIATSPDKAALYLDAGLYWKSVAEQGGGDEFFKRSLAVYEQGIEKFGQKNILFYLNAGKLAERIEDYAKAEKYYKKAIEISPADESGYLDLVDLYYYKMKKTKEEILQVFESGMTKMANTNPLIAGRATYLRRIGDYEGALRDYQKLVEIFPTNAGYKEIVQELQAQINKK